MLAIHNYMHQKIERVQVANAFAKLSKCQQFTTIILIHMLKHQLQTLLQSYQNVSNSQQVELFIDGISGCKRFCKVIKMLAIHNNLMLQFFENKLQTLLQSYQNVSNSQQGALTINLCSGCKRFCKVIKMLAIHNGSTFVEIHFVVANAFAKLSKCQQFTTQ